MFGFQERVFCLQSEAHISYPELQCDQCVEYIMEHGSWGKKVKKIITERLMLSEYPHHLRILAAVLVKSIFDHGRGSFQPLIHSTIWSTQSSNIDSVGIYYTVRRIDQSLQQGVYNGSSRQLSPVINTCTTHQIVNKKPSHVRRTRLSTSLQDTARVSATYVAEAGF